jgi:UDP-N-acetylmuramate--alanine ligase
VVLFQPHRFTRTQALLDEFATAFHDAHAVRVLDIYAASEPPLPGLDAELFARRLKEAGHPDAVYAGSVHGAAASTLIELRPGDLVLTLGAGSVTEAGPLILKGLREVNPHG